jgi:hypothetical protein
MAARWLIGCLLGVSAVGATAWGQFQDAEPGGTKMGHTEFSKWRCGVVITAAGGACANVYGYVPVPMEWPEQQVRVAEEDLSPQMAINYETIEGGAKIMTFKISHVEAGKEAKAVVTFEIGRSQILAPEKTDGYKVADPHKLGAEIHRYLGPSPKIESGHEKIRALAKQVGADKAKAWDHVEAIYDWVREHVKYDKEGHLKGAVAALRDKTGECEDMSSLFIAICRAAGIPARTVWVPGHCYAEFYLLDSKGEGHWFPCQLSGSRAFGCIPETKPILQKGDNFRPPHAKNARERQRYLAESLKVKPAVPGGSAPMVRWVREAVN